MAGYAGLGVEQNYEGGVWSLRSSGGGSPGRERVEASQSSHRQPHSAKFEAWGGARCYR